MRRVESTLPMARKNKSRYALLGMLSLGPSSGYELRKMIEGSTNHFWNEDFAQIYPTLKQLEAEGLTTKQVEKQEGRPERYVYTLTPKGWEALYRWLGEPAIPQVERNELLLKLFFGGQTAVPINMEHVQRFRALQAHLLQMYEDIEASLKQSYAQSSHLPYWLMTVTYGKHIARALLEWCDETLAQLHQLAGTSEGDGESKTRNERTQER